MIPEKITIFEEFGDLLNIDTTTNIPVNILNSLIDLMSFIVYKGTKRNKEKHKNYKSLRIRNLSGHYHERVLKNKEFVDKCSIHIEMTNKDVIEANYLKRMSLNGKEITENSIRIKINGETYYYLDNEKFSINDMPELIYTIYKKYIIQQRWKIK